MREDGGRILTGKGDRGKKEMRERCGIEWRKETGESESRQRDKNGLLEVEKGMSRKGERRERNS
jgi:hypothetical protein